MPSEDVVVQRDTEVDDILRRMTGLEIAQLIVVARFANELIHQDRDNEGLRKVLRMM